MAAALNPVLFTRFDTAALRPPDASAAPVAQDSPGWRALHAWCLAGSGPGCSPLFQPWAQRAVEQRTAVASLHGPGARALATALCLERDGSLQMQARGSAGRIALKLQTKLHDAMWWRARHAADAWDSGTLIDTPAGHAALRRFQPRRATLVVVEARVTAEALRACAEGLMARADSLAQPVRWLLLDYPAAELHGRTVQHISG